jgi:hypothetical protein
MKQTDKTSRRVPEEKAATREEIVAAVESLTRQERLRLEHFARGEVSSLGRAARGRDWEELLREALYATYEGRRRWNKEAVDFTRHLIGAMWSISSHWRAQFDPDEPFLESELISISSDGQTSSPLLNVPSPVANPERELAAKEEVERIELIASNNTFASVIVGGLRDRMTGPQIREELGISQKDYESAMKWLRRNVRDKTDKEGE